MPIGLKQSKPAALGVSGRRSTRLAIAIPIAISGKDAAGRAFKENARTIVINKHGAKIATLHQLALGAELLIENRALGMKGTASVVWIADRKSPNDPVEIGVQLLEAGNVWGIEFPPDDWQEGPPIGVGGQKLEGPVPPASSAKPPDVPPPPEIEARTPPPPPSPAAPQPFAGAPRRDASPPPQVASLRTPAVTRPAPEPTGGSLETALSQFSQRAQSVAEEQMKVFVARMAKLTNTLGVQVQSNLQNAAAGIEEKTVRALEQQIGSLTDSLQLSRLDVDALLTRYQELQQSAQTEVEKTQRNIEQASWQAVQAAAEQLSEKLQREMDSLTANFREDTRKRVQEEASLSLETLAKQASARMATLLDTYVSKSIPEIQAQQADILQQTKEQISEVAQFTAANTIDALQKQSDALLNSFQAQLEKTVNAAKDKGVGEVSDHLRKTARDLVAASADEFQRQANGARQVLKEELKTAAKSLGEEGRKQLAALAKETVDALNKSVASGLAEFRSEVQKGLHEFQQKSAKELERHQDQAEHTRTELDKALAEFQEKGARELESHFQKSAEKHRDALLKQLQRETDEAAERAVAQIHAKIDLAVKEASETVNRNVASAAVFLGAIEEKARVNLEEHARNYRESAKSSTADAEKQLAELSKSLQEKIHEARAALEKHSGEKDGKS